MQQTDKKIGEVRINKYLVRNDSVLLKLEEAKVKNCSVANDEAKRRGCKELDKAEGRECEELVLVYRSCGCIKQTEEVDLDETVTVKSGT
ncbi:MAG TPA: hypothetical protein VK536_00030 [Candidatus Limnocylindrales bacterium]|nr:hypothetical protein [Candidatus Limnocylindrales bacterium]